jgi:hypothetical protein
MVARIQILRSGTAGNRPTGKQYGEPYVNMAENQFGVMNASNVAQDLLGVPMFSPSKTYVAGNAVNNAGRIYRALGAVSAAAFNPIQWSEVASLLDVAASAGTPLLQTVSASGQNFVAFTNLDTTYEEYEIDFRGLQVSAGGLSISFQVSSDNGVTWIGTSSYFYEGSSISSDGSSALFDSAGAIAILITPFSAPAFSSFPTYTIQGKITLVEPAVAGYNKSIHWTTEGWGNDSNHHLVIGAGSYTGTVALNAVRCIIPGGNTFTNGTFKLYGTRK